MVDDTEKEDPVARIRRLGAEIERMPSLLHQRYFRMAKRWREIVRQPVPKAAKQEACLALLIDLVDQLAAARVGQTNAPLRFFADMVQLRFYLGPSSDLDELFHVAILPSCGLVSDWLLDNAHAGRTKSDGGSINIARYMAWQQMRATMLGEQAGNAALDPSDVHSEYVQAVLRRVIGPA